MNKDLIKLIKNLDEQQIEQFKNSYDKFIEVINKIKENIPQESLDVINKFLTDSVSCIADGFKFKLEFVIDTNIIFAEILAILKNPSLHNQPSFLQKFLGLPFLKIYSSPRIKEELFYTINKDLPEESNKNRAYALANSFLEKIEFIPQENLKAKRRAYELLAQRDITDAPFLEVAISLSAQGIITRDKDFKIQKDIDVYQLGESKRIAIIYSHGILSLYFLEKSLTKVLPDLINFFIILFQGFLEICREVYASIKLVFNYLAGKYANLPKWAQISIPVGLLVIPTLILIFSEKSREGLKSFLTNLKENLNMFIKCVNNDIRYNIEITKTLFMELLPYFKFSMDAIGYIYYSIYKLGKDIKTISNQTGI